MKAEETTLVAAPVGDLATACGLYRRSPQSVICALFYRADLRLTVALRVVPGWALFCPACPARAVCVCACVRAEAAPLRDTVFTTSAARLSADAERIWSVHPAVFARVFVRLLRCSCGPLFLLRRRCCQIGRRPAVSPILPVSGKKSVKYTRSYRRI